MSRGEVWWGETPKHGRRPYLILHRNVAIGVLAEILVCPLTRTIRGIDTEVPLDADDGLPQACVASLDNLVMLPVAHLTERITRLGAREDGGRLRRARRSDRLLRQDASAGGLRLLRLDAGASTDRLSA